MHLITRKEILLRPERFDRVALGGADGRDETGQHREHRGQRDEEDGGVQREGCREGVGLGDFADEHVARDEQDRNRPIAPLKQAEDAILVDTTYLDLEESLQALKNAAKRGISQ